MKTVQVKRFFGLNNVSDPLRLSRGWLAQADNVDVTDTGALVKRKGYSKLQTGNFSSAFSTFDYGRLYVVKGSELHVVTTPTTSMPLVTGLDARPMFWTETNNQVFYNNGVDRGIINPDNSVEAWDWPVPAQPTVAAVTGSLPAGLYQVRCAYMLPDARMTGAGEVAEIELDGTQALQISGISQLPGHSTYVFICPAGSTVYQMATNTLQTSFVWNDFGSLGRDLYTLFMDPLPLDATVICAWRGRLYAAMHMPQTDQTVIWYSEPLAYHLFNLNSNFIMVPGRVHMMAALNDALLIGTDMRVLAYDGEKLTQVADYGVPPGRHWAHDDSGTVLFWTVRGLCSALPFANLTERQVSVAPGAHAAGTIVWNEGRKRYLVSLQQGGSAFNPRN